MSHQASSLFTLQIALCWKRTGVKWSRQNKEGKIPGSRQSTWGYILTYSRQIPGFSCPVNRDGYIRVRHTPGLTERTFDRSNSTSVTTSWRLPRLRTSNDWPRAPSDSHVCTPLLLLDLHLKLFLVMYWIKINDDDDDVERTSRSWVSGWHIRDKLWPMPNHGSVLCPQKP